MKKVSKTTTKKKAAPKKKVKPEPKSNEPRLLADLSKEELIQEYEKLRNITAQYKHHLETVQKQGWVCSLCNTSLSPLVPSCQCNQQQKEAPVQ